jgi:hypothetical protein
VIAVDAVCRVCGKAIRTAPGLLQYCAEHYRYNPGGLATWYERGLLTEAEYLELAGIAQHSRSGSA